MRHLLACSLLVLVSLLGPQAAFAADDADDTPAEEEKQFICDRYGRYPRGMVAQSQEGWVNLRYTMKADGHVADVEVISVFGDPVFAESAQKAFASCRVTHPEKMAPQGGEAQNLRTRYFFRMEPQQKSADPAVSSKIREAKKHLMNGNIDEADSLLQQAEKDSTNLYEFTHIIINRSALAMARGDRRLALSYVDGAIENKGYIGAREFQQLLRLRLSLEIADGQYVRAQKTAQEMAERPRDGDDKLLAQLAALKELVDKANPLTVGGRIPVNCDPTFCNPEQPLWAYMPYNRTVSLADITGTLSEVVFRCGQKTARFKAEAGITWTIPKSWGECRMEITGSTGTSFNVLDENL